MPEKLKILTIILVCLTGCNSSPPPDINSNDAREVYNTTPEFPDIVNEETEQEVEAPDLFDAENKETGCFYWPIRYRLFLQSQNYQVKLDFIHSGRCNIFIFPRDTICRQEQEI